VDLSVRDGRLVATPVAPPFTLRALLARLRPAHLHGETDLGSATGREEW
jgi:antitoxin component of MazEF toxin-antitoxin module